MNITHSILIVTFFLSACSPALPGSVPAPKDFKVYSDKSEQALIQAREDLAESKKILEESKALLEKMHEVKKTIDAKEIECKKSLIAANQKLKSAESQKIQASKILKQLEEEKQKIAEAPKPSPTPSVPAHSASDAP